MEDDVKVKSLYKALKLLDYFTLTNPERGISELAEFSGMYKSSVHNIVSTFEKCGFLEKNVASRKYRLGLKILQLNNCLYMTNDLRKTVRPFLEKVSNFTNETVYFGIPSEKEVLYLDEVYPTGMRTAGRPIIGIKAPMYCTGIGKAMLSFLSVKQIEDVLKSDLVSFTQNTITDKEKLIKELKLTKERGFAIDNMEHEYGIKCVAVPIRNINGNVVASFSISGPSLRFTDEKINKYAKFLIKISNELNGLITISK